MVPCSVWNIDCLLSSVLAEPRGLTLRQFVCHQGRISCCLLSCDANWRITQTTSHSHRPMIPQAGENLPGDTYLQKGLIYFSYSVPGLKIIFYPLHLNMSLKNFSDPHKPFPLMIGFYFGPFYLQLHISACVTYLSQQCWICEVISCVNNVFIQKIRTSPLCSVEHCLIWKLTTDCSWTAVLCSVFLFTG